MITGTNFFCGCSTMFNVTKILYYFNSLINKKKKHGKLLWYKRNTSGYADIEK